MQLDGLTNSERGEPVYSLFTRDPDMLELVELFVRDLPDRIDALCRAAAADDYQELAQLAHQLKGAGGGYGFPSITEAGARVEAAAKDLCRPTATASDVRRVRDGLAELISLCRRTAASPPSLAG